MRLIFIIDKIATEKGFTPMSLHYKSGVNYTTVNSYWFNKSEMFTKKVLERLAEALDVKPSMLLAEAEEVDQKIGA